MGKKFEFSREYAVVFAGSPWFRFEATNFEMATKIARTYEDTLSLLAEECLWMQDGTDIFDPKERQALEGGKPNG